MTEIRQIHEGKASRTFYISKESWVCGYESERVRLGLMIDIVDVEFMGDNNDPITIAEDVYPLEAQFRIMPHEPAVNRLCKDSDTEDMDARRVALSYHGSIGVPVSWGITSIKSEGREHYLYSKVIGLDADVREYLSPTGQERLRARFRTMKDAVEFANRVVDHSGDVFFGILIGFVPDKPINFAGQNGWSMIEALVEGRDWEPIPKSA